MADQAGTVAGSSAGTQTQIGSTVTTEGGAELKIRVSGASLAASETILLEAYEEINDGTAVLTDYIVFKGANAPDAATLGPISVSSTAAVTSPGLTFYITQDSGTMRTFNYEIREF